ncbi:peptidoglycan recognition protein family protein [Xylanimonas ulmi]|uniref:N-acetylmuramoyl-L-alanine amidase n=1 Tax=Xylanimonas ulmi TaxID=228973 RepID=A0A4Q7M1I1_9MICO|nr:peptidoglycan recognition family protein [Xylanibacterium ulmi]RZS61696.1 N-acetylmuramoyl-L-alanine amidase [Xylanibacterium ulmi]
MTYSPLTTETMPPTGLTLINGKRVHKWSSRPAGTKIRGLNVHHHADTGTGGIDRLVKSSAKASANYIIRTSGALIGSVPEEYRAWTTSSAAADNDKITVEIQNSTGAPEWRISDAAWTTLVRLYADLAERHGFAPTRANVKGHQEYGVATACPGPYLLPRLGQVAAEAAALGGAAPVDKPAAPAPAKPAPAPAAPTGLTADGFWGAATTRRGQAVLGTPEDGVVTNQTSAWRPGNPGLTSGWDWTGKPGDGGSQFIAAHQRLLAQRGHYKGAIDGKAGPQYFRALQADLDTPADGVVSSPSRMVIALQQRLNEGRI